MELVKRTIHMDRAKVSGGTQITLEDDRNIPDAKPDVNTLVYENGQVKIEEVRPFEEHVTIKGKLLYKILYQAADGDTALAGIEGEIPFEEQIYMEGVTPEDTLEACAVLEDLSTGMINSRKINVQAVVNLNVQAEELYEEEAVVDFEGDASIEYRRQPMELTQLAIRKNDIFRLKEEIMLPSDYPNIFQIIFSSATLRDVEFKLLDEKISVQGEVHLFILYEGEGEEQPIRSFETLLPFGGTLECYGCKDQMIPDISYEIGHLELDTKPDQDGEERALYLEMVLDIKMHLYEEERTEILTDVYGVTQEVTAQVRPAEYRQLLARNSGKCKVTERIQLQPAEAGVLQILHSEGNVEVDDTSLVEDGITVQGSIRVKVLYVTGEDSMPYKSMQQQIPFSYTLEIPGMTEQDRYTVHPELEQLSVTMLDGQELDVKGIVGLDTVVFRQLVMDAIQELLIREQDPEVISRLPGIAVYVVQPGDSLWKIGKRYYVSVDAIREINHLTSDEIRPGDKLLIVKYPNGDG